MIKAKGQKPCCCDMMKEWFKDVGHKMDGDSHVYYCPKHGTKRFEDNV